MHKVFLSKDYTIDGTKKGDFRFLLWPFSTDCFRQSLKKLYEEFVEAYKGKETAQDAFFRKAKGYQEKDKLVPKEKEGQIPAFNYTGRTLLISFVKPGSASGKGKGLFSFRP